MTAVKRWRDVQRRAQLAKVLEGSGASEEGSIAQLLVPDEDDQGSGPSEEEWDDALRRFVVNRLLWGNPRPDITAEWARIARVEAQRWAHLLPRTPASAAEAAGRPGTTAAVTGTSWVNLGPTDALFQYNGALYSQVDSGRVTGIRVHPQSPATVYLATAGGGIWKTFDFGATNPTWFPITEGLGNLGIGALEMDPQAPETLYAGTGDPFDTAGGYVVKTTNGGASWSAPVALSGIYPAGQGGGATPLAVTAQRIRAIEVDPMSPSVVLVGTDVGLFRSTDGGASFALVNLPNAGATQVAESVWSIVYAGAVNGVSRWAVSGVYASAAGALPPLPALGGSSNPGDVWISADAGATWSSRKQAGALPATAVGRITLGAGTPSTANPPVTVIYAQLASPTGTSAVGFWRSTDSGNTFVTANGTLANPTTSADCTDVNVAGSQAWYNQAVAVDPADDNRVIAGGTYCGLRTRNGLSGSPVWENVSHWLPAAGIGNTNDGPLPYVHADWQTALIVRTGAGYRVLAGTDGGLFYSENVFDPSVIRDTTVTWRFPNRGIVTHQAYSVASGDPADGNPFVAFAGLQDNGTRFRDSPARPTTFNQVIGGDGFGATVVTAGTPATTMYWASLNGKHRYCNPGGQSCNDGTRWFELLPSLTCQGDVLPGAIRYSPVPTNTLGPTVVTYSEKQVFRITGNPGAGATWLPISPCGPSINRQIFASPKIDGLIGVPTNEGRFYVTSNCQVGNPTCTWTWSANPTGFDVDVDGTVEPNEQVFGASSIAFPPTTPAGKNPGDVFIGASMAPAARDGSMIPPVLGRIFLTQDRGTTWSPLHGNGTGFDLPNVPIHVVRYDPGDPSNSTLYVGTDLGLYRSTDAGQTWHRYGVGLPLVKVTDLFIGKAGNLLRISTYGRGLWEIYPSASAEKGVSGNGDFDRNQQIDFVDLGSMSSRLGTAPGTATQPYYDWNLDLVGSTNAVDESDLAQLLTRFGGRP